MRLEKRDTEDAQFSSCPDRRRSIERVQPQLGMRRGSVSVSPVTREAKIRSPSLTPTIDHALDGTSPDASIALYFNSPEQREVMQVTSARRKSEQYWLTESARDVREIEDLMQRQADNARYRRIRKELGAHSTAKRGATRHISSPALPQLPLRT